jgi:hypothetical protein
VPFAAALALAWALAGWCAVAEAVIVPPTTLDGPSSAIGEFGGAAVSEDGSGGVVYTKQVGGVQHVFAAQYAGGRWRAPVRVDWNTPFSATYPRIAAADGGWLVVVWVSQIATIKGRIQDALYSSTLLPGASSFGEPYIVDPDVGEGAGVSPSLAIASSGQGLVAYRAVTDNYRTSLVQTTIPQLRPGDVLADIRVAGYRGQLWSSPLRVDRDPRLTTRPPSESNGPQAGIGRGDQAVVAWQEPESNGTARIWARRVFGSTLGLAMQASPPSYGGQPVTADADAFALGVSEFGEAKVVSRVAGAPGTPLAGPRLFANTLPVSTAPTGGRFTGPKPLTAGAPAPGTAGVPSVAVDDQGDFRIAFASGATAEVMKGSEQSSVVPEIPMGAALGGGAGAVTALNPGGGGVTAWPASSAAGLPGIAVREDYPDGAAQSGLLSGAVAGQISGLSIGGSESGEALLGAREGNPGEYEIVGTRVTAPPPSLSVEAPSGWVRPAQARIGWSEAEDATGGVTYSLIVDGHVARSGIRGLSALPDRRRLGSGVRDVQVLATDASGQQTLSGVAELKVDGSPPVARVRRGRGRTVIVTVRDAQSGTVAGATRISFGDGTHVNGRPRVRHAYAHAGRYTIVVRMRDRVGNGATAHLRVSVR